MYKIPTEEDWTYIVRITLPVGIIGYDYPQN